MKDIIFAIVRVLTALITLVCLGFTIYFIVIQLWVGVASLAALTAIFGLFAYRDIRKWLAERKS